MQIEETAGTPNKFIALRQEVLLDERLNAVDKIVCARICSFDEYFESAEACAKLLGFSRIQVERAKRKLEQYGFIECIVNTGRGKRYRARYDLTKSSGQTLQNCHIRPNKIVRSDLTKLSDIEESIKERLKESERVGTAKAAPTLPPEAYQLVELLHDLMVKNKPNRRIVPSWRESWARDIEKIHRIDGREWEKIREVIEWSQKDDFWWKNILSGSTLRQKFDRLEDDMRQDKTPKVLYLS